jgi:hypothetical protein
MKLSNEALLERLSQQQWTAHNIRFNTDVTSIPDSPDFLETDLRLKAILRTLSAYYKGGLEGLEIADLGCLEGGFTWSLAQQGANVLGIEVRQQNFDKLQLIQEHFEELTLKFIKDDVKNFNYQAYGIFDVVLALGILYHLDNPVQWLNQISHTVKDILILDSHYAPDNDADLALLRPALQLGELQRFETNGKLFEGRWYIEFPEDLDPEGQLWASYSNHKSFWLTKESMIMALRQAGFKLVYEQHDYSSDQYKILTTEFPRVLMVAMK